MQQEQTLIPNANNPGAVICRQLLIGAAGIFTILLASPAISAGKFSLITAVTDSTACILAMSHDTAIAMEARCDTVPSLAMNLHSQATRNASSSCFSGLLPSTRYYYNLFADSTPLHSGNNPPSFVTAPADFRKSVVFALIGDTRTGRESFPADHRETVTSIIRHTSPAFLLHTGDLLDASQPQSWSEYFQAEKDLLSQCPIFPVRGNSDAPSSEFKEKFMLPGDTSWYSFSYGPLFFICLDIMYRKTQNYYAQQAGPQSPQYQWLANELRSDRRKSKPFTIVVFHAPLFTPDKTGERALIEMLCPLFEREKVDLVANGARHYFSYASRGGVQYIVTGGGGATLERIGRNLSPEVTFSHSAFHHVRLSAHYPMLKIEAVDNSGSVFFSHNLTSHHANVTQKLSPELPEMQKNVLIQLFGSKDCSECTEVKSEVLPLIMSKAHECQTQTIYIDIEDQSNFDRYMRLEASAGNTKHSFPVIAINNRLFSGHALHPDTLIAALKEACSEKSGAGRKGIAASGWLALGTGIVSGILLLVMAISLVNKRKLLRYTKT